MEEPGGKGALLRREGLFSSHLVEWRQARDAGALDALRPAARPEKRTAEQVEIAQLRVRAERAERELAKTRAALDVVGKAHALLELLSESADTQPPTPRTRRSGSSSAGTPATTCVGAPTSPARVPALLVSWPLASRWLSSADGWRRRVAQS